MAKSIVVLCDGTANALGMDLSNVAKFFRCLERSDQQRVFYNPGVGTIGADGWWSARLRDAKAVFEQAVAWGIDRDICAAYQFLCQTYERGDRIYLLGFSRGAYSVRIVAALIKMMGVLPPDQANLAGHALRTYKRVGNADENDRDDAETKARFQAVYDFGKVAGGRAATVHFMGLFDTVASVIVPGRNLFGLLPGVSTMPHTRRNRAVRAVRHAVAIDERRAMYRSNRWIEDQQYIADPFNPVPVPQDVKQVWFAGVHSDVGGGYPEKESGLAKIPLAWMIDEASQHGLVFKDNSVKRYVEGQKQYAKDDFTPPNAGADAHRSLHTFWWILEYLPKLAKFRETRTGSFLCLYLPRGEPRSMTRDSAPPMVHTSVFERKARRDYKPENLPPNCRTEPTPLLEVPVTPPP